jgi:hypothetical protein
MKAITLIETRKGCACCETTPRYHVMLNGKFHGELYFNMTGYTGCYLPLPPTAERNGKIGNLDIGERGISAYKKEIALLNKEWANHAVSR